MTNGSPIQFFHQKLNQRPHQIPYIKMNTTYLKLDLYTLFLYLHNATHSLNSEDKKNVFNDISYKLIEWDYVPRCELRKVVRQFHVEFQELCTDCNEEMPDYDGGEEEPRCDNCK
jgi:hypothetical protein